MRGFLQGCTLSSHVIKLVSDIEALSLMKVSLILAHSTLQYNYKYNFRLVYWKSEITPVYNYKYKRITDLTLFRHHSVCFSFTVSVIYDLAYTPQSVQFESQSQPLANVPLSEWMPYPVSVSQTRWLASRLSSRISWKSNLKVKCLIGWQRCLASHSADWVSGWSFQRYTTKSLLYSTYLLMTNDQNQMRCLSFINHSI